MGSREQVRLRNRKCVSIILVSFCLIKYALTEQVSKYALTKYALSMYCNTGTLCTQWRDRRTDTLCKTTNTPLKYIIFSRSIHDRCMSVSVKPTVAEISSNIIIQVHMNFTTKSSFIDLNPPGICAYNRLTGFPFCIKKGKQGLGGRITNGF